jgi:hypothetical protein
MLPATMVSPIESDLTLVFFAFANAVVDDTLPGTDTRGVQRQESTCY